MHLRNKPNVYKKPPASHHKPIRRRLSDMLSAGDKWITGLLWECMLMDGESGLYDTSPAGYPEFRTSAVAKSKSGMQPFPPMALWRSAPEPDTGSWWMWAMTERRSQTAYAPEPRSFFTITTITPSSSHCSPTGTTVKRTGLSATVQMCGQPMEIPKSYSLHSNSLLQTNIICFIYRHNHWMS